MTGTEEMSLTRNTRHVRRERLPGLPRKALSHEQQVEALRKMQAEADQRVLLGARLFKAADLRLTAQQELIRQIKADADELREQVHAQVDKKLCQYDEEVSQIDVRLTRTLEALEKKVDAIAADRQFLREQLGQMTHRCESMLDQCRYMLEQANDGGHHRPPAAPPPKQPAEQPGICDDKLYSSILRKLQQEQDPPLDQAA